MDQSQKTIRNRGCNNTWSPDLHDCIDKWEYWNEMNWVKDDSIEIQPSQCKGILILENELNYHI